MAEMTFWDHLDVLRRVLFRVIGVWMVFAIGFFIAAMRASPGYIAVCKELLCFLVVILFACFLDKFTFII